jgi:hypothetical protein
MTLIDYGISYEIIRYLAGKDYLNARLVFKTFDDENFMKDTQENALMLLKKGFLKHPIINKYVLLDPNIALCCPEFAYKYASQVIKDKWPPGEKVISTSSAYSYEYAKNVINGEWSPGEPAILKSAEYSYYYARSIIRNAWPPGEDIISTDPFHSLFYAMMILHNYWPKGEKIIASDPWAACNYAIEIVGGRWPPGEKVISTSDHYSFGYIRNVKDNQYHITRPAGFVKRPDISWHKMTSHLRLILKKHRLMLYELKMGGVSEKYVV